MGDTEAPPRMENCGASAISNHGRRRYWSRQDSMAKNCQQLHTYSAPA